MLCVELDELFEFVEMVGHRIREAVRILRRRGLRCNQVFEQQVVQLARVVEQDTETIGRVASLTSRPCFRKRLQHGAADAGELVGVDRVSCHSQAWRRQVRRMYSEVRFFVGRRMRAISSRIDEATFAG